ncbi:MAG TPA: IgGFc-binding protein [Polyangiaceae bacterium]|nr:IgGFc-binding protein [Polyangiaceae bacterium]
MFASALIGTQACVANGGADSSTDASDADQPDVDPDTDAPGDDFGEDVTGSGGGGGGGDGDNPATCEQATASRSYIGCEFWPTVTYNPVYDLFEFAVVLANGGEADATVTVTGPNSVNITETVPAGQLKAITLPWVSALKGPAFPASTTAGSAMRSQTSVRVNGGAYKVVSSVPVTAWQFNPLPYRKPGTSACQGTIFSGNTDCFSVSNDASLLMPATAMTGNYRVFSRSGGVTTGSFGSAPGGVAITATQDGTTVKVKYAAGCVGSGGFCVTASGDIAAGNAGDIASFSMNAGDVIELVGAVSKDGGSVAADMSGSLVQADKPIQAIGLNPLANVPSDGTGNADHLEEALLPAEVLGKEYIVAPPTAVDGVVRGGHLVRIYGNVAGTTLTYDVKPAGAPDAIGEGEVVEFTTDAAFRVTGDQPFAVGSFMLGGQLQSNSASCPDYECPGDPAFSLEVTPEQFRTKYTFLAPTDYDKNFADVLVPDGAVVTLDGAPLGGTATPIGAIGWSVVRVPLTGTDGSHKLESDKPVGLQVMGFGHATAYYYPGGLNLKLISPPPPAVN